MTNVGCTTVSSPSIQNTQSVVVSRTLLHQFKHCLQIPVLVCTQALNEPRTQDNDATFHCVGCRRRRSLMIFTHKRRSTFSRTTEQSVTRFSDFFTPVHWKTLLVPDPDANHELVPTMGNQFPDRFVDENSTPKWIKPDGRKHST